MICLRITCFKLEWLDKWYVSLAKNMVISDTYHLSYHLIYRHWWLQIVYVERCWWSSNGSCLCLHLMLVRRLGPASFWLTNWLFPELLLEGYFGVCRCVLLIGIVLWADMQLMDGCTGCWLFISGMCEGGYCWSPSWRPCTSVQGWHIVL